MGGAVLAAGIATAATGGLAAPIIAGAVAAGGITMTINAASPEYPLMDGVLGNTFKGAMIGVGAGSIGSAIRSIATFGSGTGAAIAQRTGSSLLGEWGGQFFGATKTISGTVSGLSQMIYEGGLDIVLPDSIEGGVHQIAQQVGMIASIADMGITFTGNRFIHWAWKNPMPYKPFSSQFNAHHLHPKFLGGDPSGPTVLISNKNTGFLRAIHGKWMQLGGSTVHGQMNKYLLERLPYIHGPGALRSFAQAHPEQIASMLPGFYRQFVSQLTPSTWPGILNFLGFATKPGH